jgi:hypothetical protein
MAIRAQTTRKTQNKSSLSRACRSDPVTAAPLFPNEIVAAGKRTA